MMEKADVNSGPVIYFDGCCRLCSGVIGFLAHTKAGRDLTYLPIRQLYLDDDREFDPDEIRVFSKGEWTGGAEGVMVLLHHLGGRYRAMWYILKLLPDRSLDKIYKIIARNRYRWFGKKNMCSANPS